MVPVREKLKFRAHHGGEAWLVPQLGMLEKLKPRSKVEPEIVD